MTKVLAGAIAAGWLARAGKASIGGVTALDALEDVKALSAACEMNKETIAAQQLALRDAEARALRAREDAAQLAAAIENALRMYREGAPYSAREALSVALAKHNVRMAGGRVIS